jgi:NADH dehydrogenase (ubiquinone) Fe-S protein 4
MSLLRASQHTSRFTILHLTQFSRKLSTGAALIPEKRLEEKPKLNSGEIAIQPVRDVMVADVISGAPGASYTFSYTHKFRILVLF